MAMSNDLLPSPVKVLWNGFAARAPVHTAVWLPDSGRPQAASESVKVAFSAASRKATHSLRSLAAEQVGVRGEQPSLQDCEGEARHPNRSPRRVLTVPASFLAGFP